MTIDGFKIGSIELLNGIDELQYFNNGFEVLNPTIHEYFNRLLVLEATLDQVM